MLPKFAAFRIPSVSFADSSPVPKGSLGAYEFAEDSRKIGISCGRTESSAPTTRRGVKTTCRGRRLCRPEKCCEFAGDYCKNGALCRADVGIGPYKCEVRRLSKICSVQIPQSASLTAPLGHKGSLWRGLSNIKTSPHDRGEVSRGTTLIVLAHISALLYREAPAALSRGRSKLAADRLAEGLSPSPSL